MGRTTHPSRSADRGAPVRSPDLIELVEAVRRRLAAAADADKAPQMQAYMKAAMPFRGVNAAPLQRLCREVFDVHPLRNEDEWRAAVLLLWDDAAYREERYAAIELTGHRRYRSYQAARTLDLYRHLVATGAWWDYVDKVASRRVGPILCTDPDLVAPVMRAWAADEDMWIRRTAILCQLGSKATTDADLLSYAILHNTDGSLHGHEFFIRKAIGWALREHAKTDPEWVGRFVAEHEARLSALSRREALRNLERH